MGSFKYVYGRRVWVKRVASVCGVAVLVGVAGCSTGDERYGYNGYGSRDYAATGSVPVPPEPVYGQRDAGYAYSSTAYSGGDTPYRRETARAPFAGSQGDYQTAAIERSSLPPVNGAADRSYGSAGASYTKSGADNARYASAEPAVYTGGNMFPMQPVADRQQDRIPNDDYRSRYRTYDNDPRYGNQRYDEPAGRQPATGSVRSGEYVVQRGDTLYSIARQFRMTTAELSDLNGLRGADLHPGQRLRVSNGGYNGYTASNPPSGRGYGDDRYSNNSARDGRNYAGPRDDQRGYGNNSREFYNNQRGYTNNQRGYADDPRASSGNRGGYTDARRGNGGYAEEAPAAKSKAPEYAGYGGRLGRKDSVAYTVKRGDTIFEIARRNGLSHRELADFNDLTLTAKLQPGQTLHIPRGKGYDWSAERPQGQPNGDQQARHGQPERGDRSNEKAVASNSRDRDRAPAKPVATARNSSAGSSKPVAVADVRATEAADVTVTGGPGNRTAVVSGETAQVITERHEETSGSANGGSSMAPRECEALLANPAQRSAQSFREPVQGQIISKFGAKEDGSFNDGVNFMVPKGTPVKAAENGVVAYAGDELTGFGNLVLIRHSDGFVTAYAHNEELNVKRCDVVKRGQQIGKAGATGNATKPQLHFELRKDSKPVDPETYFSRS